MAGEADTAGDRLEQLVNAGLVRKVAVEAFPGLYRFMAYRPSDHAPVVALEAEILFVRTQQLLVRRAVRRVATAAFSSLYRSVDAFLGVKTVMAFITELGAFGVRPEQTLLFLMIAPGRIVTGFALLVPDGWMNVPALDLAGVALIAMPF